MVSSIQCNKRGNERNLKKWTGEIISDYREEISWIKKRQCCRFFDSYHLIKFFKFQDGIKDFPFEGFILIGNG